MKTFARREVARFVGRSSSARVAINSPVNICLREQRRGFHADRRLLAVKPYLLADIGEGITECQVIQWFVKPGARVEQFDPICEVQSDKASVEITSRFDGVIKKLYYEPDDMAKVGKPLVDIDIQSEISEADAALLNGAAEKEAKQDTKEQEQGLEVGRNDTKASIGDTPPPEQAAPLPPNPTKDESKPRELGKHASLATPAVRHLVKEHQLKIEDIEGTGKEGRVLKEDVQRHAEAAKQTATTSSKPSASAPPTATRQVEDRTQPLTPVQSGMFKQMTKSLSIPHFLYTDVVDFSSLTTLRKKYNAGLDKPNRVTPLPIIIKAVSLTLLEFPLLNAHLDTTTNPNKPQIVLKGSHNIGIAVDSPQGLMVPVIKNVQDHSIASLAHEITRLATLARAGKLTSADLTGATFTVSNIGSIGGTAVAPVISTPQVGILGIGKARVVPAFGDSGELVRREECVFSWSADHRVVDGAYVARAAEGVRGLVEGVEGMVMRLR
ncbi:2-oxoacid dehydrogenases acyltransferase-domain-containing protein [Paraphoma chrysanthemicola]|uniref:Dihydrolipoamide acetyltransferase component of pyruvate dehydrogenase complex n=1 Tax=Paraphoma chrysanthemicola TaxID=798071 RepID=A0A8K0RME3_9PLEO|nr:2-oxoacid dehydrogenases acyltransferase-domain-containing protein [Paraphoma chrysanthemicola]